MKKHLLLAACAAALLAAAPAYAADAQTTPHQNVIAKAATNFVHNLGEPVNAANDILQGKFIRAGGAMARMLLNSTFGLGGLLDVASKSTDSCKRCTQYYGNSASKTLAFYGVPAGPKIIGNVTTRDVVGTAADVGMSMGMFSGTSASLVRTAFPTAAGVHDATQAATGK